MSLNSVYNFFERLSYYAFVVGKWLLICTMLAILTSVIVQVFFRYVLNQPLLGPAEITTWCLVWAGYIGASVALRHDEHISLGLFTSRMPRNMRFVVKLVARFIVLYFVVLFVYFGFHMATTSPAFSWAVGVKLMWAMLGIPVAGTMMLLHVVYLILKDINERYTPVETEVSV